MYGPKRSAALLRRQTPHQPINHKRVARVMKALQLRGFTNKRHIRTTSSNPHTRVLADSVSRDFTAARPKTCLSGTFTYLPITGRKNMYLATVIDCFSRKLVGFAIADHTRVELVEQALVIATGQQGPLCAAFFYSDHGRIYACQAFQQTCKQLTVPQSMGAVGSSDDNALAESFNATLKRQVLQNAKVFPDECRRRMLAWCARYNTKRLRTRCKYLSPTPLKNTHQPQ